MPRRYWEWPGLFRFDKMVEYSGDWHMGLKRLVSRNFSFRAPRAKHHRSRPVLCLLSNPGNPDISVACCARSATLLHHWVTLYRIRNLHEISRCEIQ